MNLHVKNFIKAFVGVAFTFFSINAVSSNTYIIEEPVKDEYGSDLCSSLLDAKRDSHGNNLLKMSEDPGCYFIENYVQREETVITNVTNNGYYGPSFEYTQYQYHPFMSLRMYPGKNANYGDTQLTRDFVIIVSPLDSEGLLSSKDILFGDPGSSLPYVNQESLIDRILDSGRDVLVFNFQLQSTEKIQDSAAVFSTALNWLNGRRAMGTKATVIGLSMGGLIARYALTNMEHEGHVDHDIQQFITYDTPHEGAFIPLTIQQIPKLLGKGFKSGKKKLKLFNTFTLGLANFSEDYRDGLAKLRDASTSAEGISLSYFDTPSSKQALLYHHSVNGEHSLRNEFKQDLLSIGDMPEDSINIAIANGRADGVKQLPNHPEFTEGSSFINIGYRSDKVDNLTIKFDSYVTQSGLKNSWVRVRGPSGWFDDTTTYIDTNRYSPTMTVSPEFVPGSRSFFYDTLVSKLNTSLDESGFDVLVPSPKVSSHTFVPTMSALGIKFSYDLNLNSLPLNTVNNISLFDEVYYDTTSGTASDPYSMQHLEVNSTFTDLIFDKINNL